jgi:hypothetical protein
VAYLFNCNSLQRIWQTQLISRSQSIVALVSACPTVIYISCWIATF